MTLLTGIPNAGKSTYSARYGTVIHFDSIPHKTANEQFAKCNRLAAQAEGEVCVEGVYNSRRRRIELLEACKHRAERKVCIWLDTPVEVCLERERNYRRRPDGIVLSHAQSFEPPTLDEGWDEIIHIVYTGEQNGVNN